MTLRDLVTV